MPQRTIPQNIVRLALIALTGVGATRAIGPDLTPVFEIPDEEFFTPTLTTEEKYVLRTIDLDVTLSTDEDGYSLIRTTETVDAVFHADKGSRGIQRYLLDDYLDHKTAPEVIAVERVDGSAVSYTLGRDDDHNGAYVTINITGDAVLDGDVFYTIVYEQRQVTTQLFDEDDESESPEPTADRFQWNSLSVWNQPAAEATYRITIDPSLAAEIVGTPEFIAIAGLAGGTEPLELQEDGSYTGSASGTIAPNSFVGAEIDFEPGTFRPTVVPETFWTWASLWLPYLPIFFAIPLFIGSLFTRLTRWSDAEIDGPVVAQYEPYPGVNLVQHASVMGLRKRAIAAQLVDLAVRGAVTVRDLPADVAGELGRSGRGYEFELVSTEGLDAEELAIATLFFNSTQPGTRMRLLTGSVRIRVGLRRAAGAFLRESIRLGLRAIPGGMARVVLVWGPIAAAALQWGFFHQAFSSLTDETRPPMELVAWIATIMAISAWLIAATAFPLTALGAKVKQHVLGMREYIELAEADRLRFLQGVRSAWRTGEELDLDERMLPYAVLFGQETSWSRALATGYDKRRLGLPAWLTEPVE